MSDKLRVFDVFYREYQHNVSISSANPEPLDAKRLAPLAGKLLESPDNFFGVVDAEHTILQCYLDDEAEDAESIVAVELLYAEQPGYYQTHMSLKDALELLDKLPDRFSSEMLADAQFIGEAH